MEKLEEDQVSLKGLASNVLDRQAPVILVAMMVVILITRFPEIGQSAFFRDDALQAYFSNMPLRSMLTGAQNDFGFSLIERMITGSHNTHVATWQFLPVTAGILGVPLCWWMLRSCNLSRITSLISTAIICLSPMYIEFIVHVHPYSVEFCLTCLVLLSAVRLTSEESRTHLIQFFIISCFSLLIALAVIQIVIPSLIFVAVATSRNTKDSLLKSSRRLLPCGVGIAVVAFLLYSPTPQALKLSFHAHFYHFDSPQNFIISVAKLHGHFLLWLSSGWGINRHYPALHLVQLFISVVIICTILILSLFAISSKMKIKWLGFGVLAFAEIMALLSLYPLGDGRNDILLYPALAIVLACGFEVVASKLNLQRRWAKIVILIFIASLGVNAVITSNPYPSQDITPLYKRAMSIDSSRFMVVDAVEADNWAYYQITPVKRVRDSKSEEKFVYRSLNRKVFLAGRNPAEVVYTPKKWIPRINQLANNSLWFFGSDDGIKNDRLPSLYRELIKNGWNVQKTWRTDRTYLYLMKTDN